MNKDKASRVLVIVLWVAFVALWALKGWWYLATGLVAIHMIEVFVVGIKTGLRKGRGLFFSIVMTLIFGVTWWGPLRKD